jgi:hypothetical protein
MSKPLNPLSEFPSYQSKHVLLAFSNTVSASAFNVDLHSLGKCGDPVKGVCGPAYVLVNETFDYAFRILSLEWAYNYFSPLNPNTTSCVGNFVIGDSKGNQFPSFLRDIAKKMGKKETDITYYLLTYFYGPEGTTLAPIQTKPIIFSLTDISTGFGAGLVSMYSANFVMQHNTKVQLPTHSRMDQLTITNSKNMPNNAVPPTDSTDGRILSRREENAKSNPFRDSRIEKSIPMRNLDDLFAGFEAELNMLRFTHKRQLQEFIKILKPNYNKKIKIPKAEREKNGKLPIKFKVLLENDYKQYPVDNRNLLTEQTETNQKINGVRSITAPPGSNIYDVVDLLMSYSTKVADDANNGMMYKVATTFVTNCDDEAEITILIKKYTVPFNKMGTKDTGPDPKGNVETLQLVYMDGEEGYDMFKYSFAAAPAVDNIALEREEDALDTDFGGSAAQREALSLERSLEGGFAGLRSVPTQKYASKQYPSKMFKLEQMKNVNPLMQDTMTTISMVGHTSLYSDLIRRPTHVASENPDGPKLYSLPEYYPMYAKIKVRIANVKGREGDSSMNHFEYWYHTYHYHVVGVKNIILGGSFVQQLTLLYADDQI